MLYCLILRFSGMSKCAAQLISPHLFTAWKGVHTDCIRTRNNSVFRHFSRSDCERMQQNYLMKREQVAINWASRNSSLHKLHQSLDKSLCRVICCQSETLYYRINHRFNPCLFYSYCSHYLFNILHKLYSDV